MSKTMVEVTLSRVEKLDEDIPTRQIQNYRWASKLAAIRARAVLAADCYDYEAMIRSLCQEVLPIFHQLRDRGYNLCVFLIGPTLSAERKSRIVNYSLSKSIRRVGIAPLLLREKVYEFQKGETAAGVYVIDWEDIETYCSFLFRNSSALGFAATAAAICSDQNVDALYKASKSYSRDLEGIDINWVTVSDSFCPLGYVILKPFGAFDDREREINLIYSADMLSLTV